jgi:predicted dehydrogenase
LIFAVASGLPQALGDEPGASKKELRAGIIGLDTSHVIRFTELLNVLPVKDDLAGCRIVAAYPKGSPDIESSVSRVPEYTKALRVQGVEIVDSIDDLVKKVDVVFLETNDGRPHLEQVLPVLKAHKRVFIDKPIAGSLSDAIAIFEAAKYYNVPIFSSSSSRFAPEAQSRGGEKVGEIVGCASYGPSPLEKTHPDFFWYGIHGIEALFTVMGPGCQSVTRVSTPDTDVVVGTWKDGRVGTFRGNRKAPRVYGITVFGTKGIVTQTPRVNYRLLVAEVVKYFRTGAVPVSPEETLEIYAFMEAADQSKRQGGTPVSLESVMSKARAEAERKLPHF